MCDIYSKAERVVSWLGEAADDSDLVFPMCQRLFDSNSDGLADGTIPVDTEGVWNRASLTKQAWRGGKKVSKAGGGQCREIQCHEWNHMSKPILEASGSVTGESTKTSTEVQPIESVEADKTNDLDASNDEVLALTRMASRLNFERMWYVTKRYTLSPQNN